jgi:hypothetical protein
MNLKEFQNKIRVWMLSTFGEKISKDTHERNCRFLEEAIELVQSCGMPKKDALKLVEYVYNRPVGDPPQEVGGVMVTLTALCLAHNMDVSDAAITEMQRIWLIKDKIAAKQVSKNLAMSHTQVGKAPIDRNEIAKMDAWINSTLKGSCLCSDNGHSGDAKTLIEISNYFVKIRNGLVLNSSS